MAKLPPTMPQAPSGQAAKVKVGNPYQVGGRWFYPADDRRYDKTGVASWYGPTFHGKATANGEVFDENAVTAAHTTLPMPSWVEVTNLENGRSLVVRVNDRGPFVGDRIIDLSRRTAQLLDVERKGTAKVRVRRVFPDDTGAPPVMLASSMPAQTKLLGAQAQPMNAAPRVANADVVRTVALPPSNARLSTVPVSTSVRADARGAGIFIQVAALSDSGRATWLAGYLKDFGSARISPSATGLYRVQIGPFVSADAARGTLARVQAAGYGDARMVADSPAS